MKTIKPTCCGEVVEGSANHQSYWYCRGCKQEVNTTEDSFLATRNRVSELTKDLVDNLEKDIQTLSDFLQNKN